MQDIYLNLNLSAVAMEHGGPIIYAECQVRIDAEKLGTEGQEYATKCFQDAFDGAAGYIAEKLVKKLLEEAVEEIEPETCPECGRELDDE